MGRRRLFGSGVLASGLVLAVLASASHERSAHADPPDPHKKERCAIRLSAAFLGTSPSAELLAAPDPQAAVPALLTAPATKSLFLERFARFTNAQLDDAPGTSPEQDAAYFTAYRVLDEGLTWDQLFVGPFDVHQVNDSTKRIEGYSLAPSTVTTTTNDGAVNCGKGCLAAFDAADGLGYFRSNAWLRRYEGNETGGVKLVTANRIMQNVIGLKLQAVTNVAQGTDLSATGRQAAACRGCHYDSQYALDKIASILTKRNTKAGVPAAQHFLPKEQASVVVLGGKTITDDKSLVEALVASDAFAFRSCRLAFEFLYGRAEHTCEAPLFDACVDAFKGSKMIQDALTTVAKDPGYCE